MNIRYPIYEGVYRILTIYVHAPGVLSHGRRAQGIERLLRFWRIEMYPQSGGKGHGHRKMNDGQRTVSPSPTAA